MRRLALTSGLVESDALVDLAAQAPACGEVHKDGLAGGEGVLHGVSRPGLPVLGWHRCAVRRAGRQPELQGRIRRKSSWAPRRCRRSTASRMSRGNGVAQRCAGQRPRNHPAMASSRKQASSAASNAAPYACARTHASQMTVPKMGTRDGLLEHLHPRAGLGQHARPCGLQRERDIRRGEAESERGEDGECDGGGLRERVADGCAHERRGARRGDDDGENAGEEAARVSLLCGERSAGAGEREADFKLAGEREAEEEEQRRHQRQKDRRLELESPAERGAGGAQAEQAPTSAQKETRMPAV